jgi:hypothetical protein
LVEVGADKDQAQNQGATPLFIAASHFLVWTISNVRGTHMFNKKWSGNWWIQLSFWSTKIWTTQYNNFYVEFDGHITMAHSTRIFHELHHANWPAKMGTLTSQAWWLNHQTAGRKTLNDQWGFTKPPKQQLDQQLDIAIFQRTWWSSNPLGVAWSRLVGWYLIIWSLRMHLFSRQKNGIIDPLNNVKRMFTISNMRTCPFINRGLVRTVFWDLPATHGTINQQ